MSAVKVTITEVNAADDGFDYGEGELTCDGPVCNRSIIGYHLVENPDSGMDEQAFATYWEITPTYGIDDVDEPMRVCESCLSYLEDIAPAIVAQTVRT